MYNFPSSSPYGRPPGFGGFPGQQGAPPGMAPPPGMVPPGMAAAPGMQQLNTQQPGRPSGFPPNFQPPANMPNINFSAPVIRLGTTGPMKPATPIGGDSGRRDGAHDQRSNRPGLGVGQSMEAQRQALRDSMLQLIPPTSEEILRTVFVGGITEGAGGDEGVERILRSAGNLKRWTRAMDAENKACRFGFAEYEDPESLATAVDVLKDVEVPIKPPPLVLNIVKDEDEEEKKIEKSKLLVVFDDASMDYLEQYQASRGDEDPIRAQLRLDAAKSALAIALSELEISADSTKLQRTDMSKIDSDVPMENGIDMDGAEIVTIPLTADDELSDIPAEMRETVAKEITAFRDRSNRRDMERMKREEEIEAQERARALGQSRRNRLSSPPLSAPAGPGGGANGIPLGPRDRGVLNAPAGPKGYSASQLPRDYQKGVSFVNGTGLNGAGGGWINREDEDSEASDEELEKRRTQKRDDELEKQFLDQERRWLNRERSRTAAVEREKMRDKDEAARLAVEKEAVAKRLREWNDEIEASRKSEEYYLDRSLWLRNRTAFRAREANLDDMDRANEERDKAREQELQDQARGMADDFLARQAAELDSKSLATPREPQRFKLSLGAATQQKAQQAAASSRRTVAEVEGLLEDEEEASASQKRTLIPITFEPGQEAAGLSEEERAQAVQHLAKEIPTDKDGLWGWDVKWDFVDEGVVTEKLRPFVEKKIVEYLGVQEQMLVEVVEEHVRRRGKPDDLVGDLEGALDDEAEVLVRKLWRMIIFFSESEKRGLSV
ncbi:hypothetical protein MMC25_006791 [Agyrium rufum]|nr:hypothetical protein [Agyrium rufum]